jgi:hypothetical protein
MWKLPNGKILSRPKSIRIGDVNYPAGIFTAYSKLELSLIGIRPFREESFDTTNYRSISFTDELIDGDIVRIHEVMPKLTLAKLKKKELKKIKDKSKILFRHSKSEMAYLIEFEDEDPDQWELWSAYIAALKQLKHDVKADFALILTVGTLLDYVRNIEWPEQPIHPDDLIEEEGEEEPEI